MPEAQNAFIYIREKDANRIFHKNVMGLTIVFIMISNAT